MNSKTFSGLFPLGSHLCREPMPAMSELKRDMDNLKRHGFNLVKLQEHWMIDEPVEGCCDFSRYEELIEYAARLELGVYLGLTCEQAPAWLWRKYPDCRMVGQNGLPIAYEAQTTLPADGKPGPCYDHPGAMADQLRFIRMLVQTLGRFENVVVWNTWQEIGYWAPGLAGQHVCYCPHTLTAFRGWLKRRFADDLESLNRSWNTRYADWLDLVPDRCVQKIPVAVNIFWQHFMDNEQIGNVLRARAEVIRDSDPLKRPVFAHLGSPHVGSGQDWAYARCQDFLGSSCYPAGNPPRYHGVKPDAPHAALLAELYQVAQHFDYIRSCNRSGAPIWAAEFQGGPVSSGFQKGRVPFPEDIRRWMLTAVASGVSAISFWVTRSEIMAAETNGFSLLDSEGDTTPRFEEAARIGRALNRYADLFGKPSWAGAQVGILVNEWNYQFCAQMSQGGGNVSTSVGGWHRILWEAGIPVDFVEVSELDEAYASKYKTLILPFPLSLSESVARKLARYVEQGGILISEAAPGRIDENAFCNRGELSPVMRELFGVRQQSFTMVREPEGGTAWSPAPRTWGEYLDAAMLEGTGLLAGHRLRANIYIQTFAVQQGEPCLLYGRNAVGVWRKSGKGTAILLGTYVGLNGAAYRDAETRGCIAALLKNCGVTSMRRGKLLLRKRVLPGKEAWLLTNPGELPVQESISVAGWRTVEDLLGQSIIRDGDEAILTVNSLDVRVLVLTK